MTCPICTRSRYLASNGVYSGCNRRYKVKECPKCKMVFDWFPERKCTDCSVAKPPIDRARISELWAKGWTKTLIAKETGCSYTTVSRVVGKIPKLDRVHPRWARLLRYAWTGVRFEVVLDHKDVLIALARDLEKSVDKVKPLKLKGKSYWRLAFKSNALKKALGC